MGTIRPTILNGSGSVIWDVRFSNDATMTLTGNVVLSLSGMDDGKLVNLLATQDSVGGHTLTIVPLTGTTNRIITSTSAVNGNAQADTQVEIRNIARRLTLTYTDPTVTGGGGGGAVSSVAGKTGAVTLSKNDVGLNNVDNTSDASKPVSALQLTALNAKEATITIGTVNQYWRGDKSFQTLDKTAVGLSNVDNTSDANKPVSAATLTALNLKANTSSLAPVATSGAYSDLSGKPTYTVLATMPGSLAGYVDGSEIVITG